MTNKFILKSLDGPDQEMTIDVGWDGDISITIYDYDERYGQMVPHTVRIGMGVNSGDPNGDIKDIKYIKGALRALANEFQYQEGKISEEEIQRYRNAPKVPNYLEAWFND